MLRILFFLVFCLAVSSTYAQKEISGANVPEASAPTASPGVSSATSAITPAKYRGRVTERQGTRSSDFDLDLSQNPGTIIMYRAEPACRRGPISVTSVKDGLLRLESKSPIAGCTDRVFELMASGNELTGTMMVADRVFDVKATKQ